MSERAHSDENASTTMRRDGPSRMDRDVDDANKPRPGKIKMLPEDIEEIRMRKTTGIADRIFKAPSPTPLLITILALSLVIGFLSLFDLDSVSSNLSWDRFYSAGLVFGVVMIGIPALIAAAAMTPVAKMLGGIFYFRRAVLLVFTSIMIMSGIFLIAKLLSFFLIIDFVLTLALSYACIFAIHLMTLLAISNNKYQGSIPPALLQPGTGLILLAAGYSTVLPDYSMDSTRILIILLFMMIFLCLTVIWIYIITRPLGRSYGIDGLKIMQQAFAHFTEGESAGLELENFFESFGKTVTASVSVLAVKKLDGTKPDKKTRYKALVVVPDVHKGPFGYLGGSNMPEKFARELGESTEHLLVPHGTATHDMNPVSTAETNRLSRAVKNALDELKPSQFSASGSRFMRAKGPSNVNLTIQFIGETPVSTYTSAPEPTDDINRQIGPEARKVMLSGNKNGKKTGRNPNPAPLFIDAHNSMVPGKGYVHYNSDKSRTIIKTLKNAVIENIKTKTKNGLEIGVAEQHDFDVEKDGLGPMGIQVIVVNTPPDNKVAYILFDGNNLELGLRKQIIAHVKAQALVDNVEVLTTDNHIVNMTIGGYSPVGKKLGSGRLFKSLDKLVKEANADLEPVEVASTGFSLDNFKVFGPGNTLKLSTTINNTMSLMGKSFVICYGTAFGLAVAVMAIMIA